MARWQIFIYKHESEMRIYFLWAADAAVRLDFAYIAAALREEYASWFRLGVCEGFACESSKAYNECL